MFTLQAAAWYVSAFDKVWTEVQNSQCICQKIVLRFRDVNRVRQRGKGVTSQRHADGNSWEKTCFYTQVNAMGTTAVQKNPPEDSKVWCFQRKWQREGGRLQPLEGGLFLPRCSKVFSHLDGCRAEFINTPTPNFSPPGCASSPPKTLSMGSVLHQKKQLRSRQTTF